MTLLLLIRNVFDKNIQKAFKKDKSVEENYFQNRANISSFLHTLHNWIKKATVVESHFAFIICQARRIIKALTARHWIHIWQRYLFMPHIC